MKTAILYVFSGTGNTYLLAEEFKRRFEDKDILTTIYNISADFSNIPNANGYDIVGVGYPIHAFNAPQLVIRLAKKLEPVDNKYTFIFKSSGEPLKLNNASSSKLIKILTHKGYNVSLERHIVMPYNMIFRHNDDLAKQLWVLAKQLVKIYAREVVNGKQEKVTTPIYKKLHTVPFRIEWFGAKLNGKFYKVDTEKCSKCMKCVRTCPTNNIKYEDGKFKFGGDCIMCVRCSFGCPKNAINIGFLNSWKVNGSYKLKQLESDRHIKGNYINNNTKGLYKAVYRPYVTRSQHTIASKMVLDDKEEKKLQKEEKAKLKNKKKNK